MRKNAIALLHDASEDVRFRVREIVPIALAKLGAMMGDALVHDLASWMDGFFQASAALLAMAQPSFLPAHRRRRRRARAPRRGLRARQERRAIDLALSRSQGARRRARDRPRRHGWRASACPCSITSSRGRTPRCPSSAAAIEAVLARSKLTSRYATELKRVRAALDASLPPPRDPTLAVRACAAAERSAVGGRLPFFFAAGAVLSVNLRAA